MRRDSPNILCQGNDIVGVHVRHLLRPPQRRSCSTSIPIGGRTDGQITNERQYNGDWNPVWEVEVGRFERRLDGRGGHPVQVAALPARTRADLGLQRAARQPVEERDLVPDAHAAGARAAAASSRRRWRRRVVGLEAPAGSKNLEVKPYVIVDLTTDRTPRAGDLERPRRRRRLRREVRRHAEPDRRLHLQHRLRAGRGRRAAGQPDALQPVLSGEARVLSREPGHVRVRRRRHDRQQRRQRATRRSSSTAAASA